MKSLSLTRGVVLTGALTLTHAVSALADGTATTQAALAAQRHTEAVLAAFGQQTGAYGGAAKSAARATGENTPINASSVPGATHVSSGGSSLVRTIVGLFIVIAVIYGIAWILRLLKSGRAAKTEGSGLAAVASVSLGTGRSLQLVRAGQELVLLGVAEHGVTPIRRYTEEEARAAGFTIEPADADGDAGSDSDSDSGSGPRVRAVVDRRAGLGRSSMTSGGRRSPSPGGSALDRLLDALRRMTVRS